MDSQSPTMAKPTVVLIPFCVPGHLTSILEAGKRLLNSSGRHAMSLTVLITQIKWMGNNMSEVADLIRREEEAESGFDIRFHYLPAVEPPVWQGVEDFISRFVQLHAPHVKAAVSGLASPVAAVVVDLFCTTLFDVTRELELPAYVYFTSAASMLALMLRLPALDAEVEGNLGEVDGTVDIPGMPPVPAALMPTPLLKKDVNYTWFVYHGNRFMEAAGIIVNGHRFLWVLRGPPPPMSPYPTDANVGEMLPEGFLERTKGRGLVWPKWAPQKDILGHAAIGGFVTHCGWNSALESLWHGVPMVPWPLYAEQHLNAFLLVDYPGVAVAMKFDRKRNNFVEAAELERAVKALMDDGEEGRKAREKTAEMKAACRDAVEVGGSSYAALQRLSEELQKGTAAGGHK